MKVIIKITGSYEIIPRNYREVNDEGEEGPIPTTDEIKDFIMNEDNGEIFDIFVNAQEISWTVEIEE